MAGSRLGAVRFRLSVHLPFQSLQPIDVALCWTIAPDGFDRILRGGPIFLQLLHVMKKKNVTGATPSWL